MNREQWLNAVAEALRPTFVELGYTLPPFRVSIGFTSKGQRSNRIGECWSRANSRDGHHEIYLVPTMDDAEYVAATLAHELCHCAVGIEAGHGPAFRKVATGIGLEGKMTATVAGEGFKRIIAPILATVGPLPHARLLAAAASRTPRVPKGEPVDPGEIINSGPKKQTTRLLKCECPSCGYTIRTTKKWLAIAIPSCPVDGEQMTTENGEEE